MTTIQINYGWEGLVVEAPEGAAIFQTRDVPGVPDETTAILRALRNPIQHQPLRSLVQSGSRVVLVHSDITRSTPNARLLPVILDELEAAAVKRDDIVFFERPGNSPPTDNGGAETTAG